VEKQSNNKREGKIIAHSISQRNMLEIQVIWVENLLPKFGHPVAVCSKILDGAMHPGIINQ